LFALCVFVCVSLSMCFVYPSPLCFFLGRERESEKREERRGKNCFFSSFFLCVFCFLSSVFMRCAIGVADVVFLFFHCCPVGVRPRRSRKLRDKKEQKSFFS
jgi:hypothetical protein